MTTQEKSSRDWYSVSLDTLRISVGTVLTLLVTASLFIGFTFWNEYRIEQKASEMVANARSLVGQLRVMKDLERHQGSYERGSELLSQAEQALVQEDFREAAKIGEESFQMLSDVLDQILNNGEQGIAWFVNVEGEVQYRRGESGPFVKAHSRDFLFEGDYVRSASSASAEIYFHWDETRFTIRPNTFFKVSGGRRANSDTLGFMEYGYVDLDTSQASSGVETRYSQVRISENSNASVEIDRKSKQSRIRVSEGGARVTSRETGEVAELNDRQQVIQKGSELGRVVDIPDAPRLLTPDDNHNVDIDSTKKVQLRWQEVPDATRYALQISRSRLFGSTIIDTSRRVGNSATLGLRDEGSYVWRVAAISNTGVRGAWSEPRKFRVESWRGLAIERDEIAPPLEVDVIMNGNIAILRGKSEPGARVEMDGKEIPVSGDGTFSTSEAVDGRGAKTLVFRAIDDSGNFREVKKQVYLPID